MEYGEAISSKAFSRAVTITGWLRIDRRESPAQLAWEAVSQAYCVCVADDEDTAEHRFSDDSLSSILGCVTPWGT